MFVMASRLQLFGVNIFIQHRIAPDCRPLMSSVLADLKIDPPYLISCIISILQQGERILHEEDLQVSC